MKLSNATVNVFLPSGLLNSTSSPPGVTVALKSLIGLCATFCPDLILATGEGSYMSAGACVPCVPCAAGDAFPAGFTPVTGAF